jgi:hypothetical protein
MALIPRLLSGSSAKRPEPSGINAMPPVQQNSTGQPWVLAGRARCHRSGEHALVTGKAQKEDENGGG